MDDFLAFRKFITPLFITIIFWIGAGMMALSALATMFRGGIYILVGLVWLVAGPLAVRVYCELMILLFRIYDELVAMRTGVPPAGDVRGFPVTPIPPVSGGTPPTM